MYLNHNLHFKIYLTPKFIDKIYGAAWFSIVLLFKTVKNNTCVEGYSYFNKERLMEN